jgi:hypothetical protein
MDSVIELRRQTHFTVVYRALSTVLHKRMDGEQIKDKLR